MPLPQGLSVRWDAEQGIILNGIPKQNASNVSATVTVDGVQHAFRWTVFESDNRVLSVKNVGGKLADNSLAGTFLLTNQADGSVAITLTTAEGTRQGTAIGWQNGSKHSSVQFSHSVVSGSLPPHGLQHTRLPCLSPTQDRKSVV